MKLTMQRVSRGVMPLCVLACAELSASGSEPAPTSGDARVGPSADGRGPRDLAPRPSPRDASRDAEDAPSLTDLPTSPLDDRMAPPLMAAVDLLLPGADPADAPDLAPPPPPPDGPRGRFPGLPLVYNYAPASDPRVATLIAEALGGLGFGPGDPSGPQPEDRVFVGRYLMAWIDETGFYGKMNGLWRLNGVAGDALDFEVRDGDRPLNFLIVGERGDGQFPPGYPGAEHIEFPSGVPEPNDDPTCGDGDWCNQYALNEATNITDRDIPWWRACNNGGPTFGTRFLPIEEDETEGGLRLMYEGPLVKEADGDGTHDGDDCHAHWLFEDGVRRRVNLRVGYEFRRDDFAFDRLMQLSNPEGNPTFDGPMSLIGGFVITSWPNAHIVKRLDQYLRPELRDQADTAHGLTLRRQAWNDHDRPVVAGDEIFAWMGQPVSLSVAPGFVTGRSVTLSHEGASDNDDVGFCLCSVHGGFELGGGLIHGGLSLPLAAGQSSPEARRRLSLPPGLAPREPQVRVFEAEVDLAHNFGRLDGDGWSANTAQDDEGHLIYGPYANDLGDAALAVGFRMLVDNVDAEDLRVVILDVFDADAAEILASVPVSRADFIVPFQYQDFTLDVSLVGRAGHRIETRVYWEDTSYVKVDHVSVRPR